MFHLIRAVHHLAGLIVNVDRIMAKQFVVACQVI